jgi:hypothetical protein
MRLSCFNDHQIMQSLSHFNIRIMCISGCMKHKELCDMLLLKDINKIDYLSGMCCLIVLIVQLHGEVKVMGHVCNP